MTECNIRSINDDIKHETSTIHRQQRSVSELRRLVTGFLSRRLCFTTRAVLVRLIVAL
jgi:hypothetical protein